MLSKKSSTNQQIKLHVILSALIMLIASAMILFNFFTYQYEASSYIAANGFIILFPGFLIYYFSKSIEETLPTLRFLLYGLWLMIIITFAINIFTVAIQYTPFSLHDSELHQLDVLLGFNIMHFLDWTHRYPWLIKICRLAYSTVIVQLLAIPFILIFLQQQRRFSVYVNVCMMASIVGYLIYYFYPSSTPAHIFTSPYFTEALYSVSQRFYDVQHHIPNTQIYAGIIGFPSFHTIWAICAVYAVKNYKPVFWSLLIWNSIVLFSTVALGIHFLVDVIAGAVIVIAAIPIAEAFAFGKDYSLREMLENYKRDFQEIRNTSESEASN